MSVWKVSLSHHILPSVLLHSEQVKQVIAVQEQQQCVHGHDELDGVCQPLKHSHARPAVCMSSITHVQCL